MAFDVHTAQKRGASAASGSSTGGRPQARPPRRTDVGGGDGGGQWPQWAVPQLLAAAAIADGVRGERGLVLPAELYRRWFNPVLGPGASTGRPLAGVYRSAHAGSAHRIERDGLAVVDRNDVVGRDGWWRTWNDRWLPTRSRAAGVRLLLSPRPERAGDLVRVITSRLRGAPVPWLLAVSTHPARLGRPAAATLYVQHSAQLPLDLLQELRPLLQDVTPPLTLPIVPGAGLAQTPGNGMSFGEHRCHLVALALRTAAARRDPLAAIADVFRMHSVDPAHPYRS
jgi:hypothetical protein